MTTGGTADRGAARDLLAGLIRDVPDFPRPGILFKDVTPLLASPRGLAVAVTELVADSPREVDLVVGTEARGFILAAPVALALGVGFVPVRKPGRLPREVVTEDYDLEYGTGTLAVHRDAIPAGARVLVVDDVLATGGTAAAACELVDRTGAQVVAVDIVCEISSLGGRDRLRDRDVQALLQI